MTNFLFFELTAMFLGAGLTASIAVCRACLPQLVRRADAAAETRGAARRLLLGLLNGPAIFAIAGALASRLEWKLPALGVMVVLIALTLWGFLASLPRLGRRILALSGRDSGSDLRQTLTGGAALTAAFLLPVAGWLITAVCLFLAIGTGVSAVFLGKPPAESR